MASAGRPVGGNPPWRKVTWDSGAVLGDFEPKFVLRGTSALDISNLRDDTFARFPEVEPAWLAELEQSEGTQSFLNANSNFPQLRGVQTNLYKCFLPRAWRNASPSGISGFLHQEGVYDDPNGGQLRRIIYSRLRAHYQFTNVKLLFADVMIWKKFSINIYGKPLAKPHFVTAANIFDPMTIDLSHSHDGSGPVPGIKEIEVDDDGTDSNWSIRGHADRLLEITLEDLALFAALFDEGKTADLEARLPAIHARPLLAVLKKFAAQPRRLEHFEGQYMPTEMWHETNAQKDGTLKSYAGFAKSREYWILSGPHFYVSNPFYKTPRRVCDTPRAYDPLDLTAIPDDYLPRTNYIPACDLDDYRSRMQKVAWSELGVDPHSRVADYYRVNTSRALGNSGERTLQASIMPPGAGHIGSVFSIAPRDPLLVPVIAGLWSSLPMDFFVKSTGKADLRHDLARLLPVPPGSELNDALIIRTLSLCCLTTDYADLWSTCWKETFRNERWSRSAFGGATAASGLDQGFFGRLGPKWARSFALRSDLARRQALLEIDVLVCMAMGISLDQLLAMYSVLFPVLQQNELDTWYDQEGRIIFTCNIGLAGYALPRHGRRSDSLNGTKFEVAGGGGAFQGCREASVLVELRRGK